MSPAMICLPVTPVDAVSLVNAVSSVNRARALIGTKFRLHGRDPLHGLDCVGLIAEVFGWHAHAPYGYALRGGCADEWSHSLDTVAVRRTGSACVGDVMLLQAGLMQFHLGIWTGSGLIHADASVRRVVETPGAVRWPVVAIWFKSQDS